MKFFISCDIEGVAGISTWREADRLEADHQKYALQMTREATAACEGILETGDHDILVRDAHASARNMDISAFPENVKFIRGWSGHPYSMMDGIDETYDACLMIGYHSPAGSERNPLAHTNSSSTYFTIHINGERASECMINSFTAASLGVPLLFLSGDKGICEEAEELCKGAKTVATTEGTGHSVLSLHPNKSVELIRQTVAEAVKAGMPTPTPLPKKFTVQLRFKEHIHAYSASFYPGVKLLDCRTLEYTSDQWFDILTMIKFSMIK